MSFVCYTNIILCAYLSVCTVCATLSTVTHWSVCLSVCGVVCVCPLCGVPCENIPLQRTPYIDPPNRTPLYKTHRKTPSDSLQSYCTIRFGFLSTVSKKCVDMLKGLTFGKLRAKTPIPPHLKRYKTLNQVFLNIFVILRHLPISLTSYIIPFKINQFFNCYPYKSKILIYDIMVMSPHVLLCPII